MEQMMSDQIDQLATALAKAQSEYKVAIKNRKNPYFKSMYADFEAVVEASGPALNKYGLSVNFKCDIHWESQTEYIIGTLKHSSGQWEKSKLIYKPTKQDVQSLSSYNTYIKRMIYCNLTGVVTGDEDDDGEAAMQYTREQPGSSIITPYQHTQLMALVNQFESTKEQKICAAFGIDNLTKLPVVHYAKTMSQLKDQLTAK